MRKMLTKTCFLVALLCFLTSCASIIHGSSQSVDFSSQPAGAKVTVDDIDFGSTPKTIVLKRRGRMPGEDNSKKEYKVKIQLDGYYPYEIKIKREMDGWFLGNILFGGVIGIIVDASNGAMYKLSPDQVIAQMNKTVKAEVKSKDDKIYVAVVLHPDPNWERIGTIAKKN